MITPDIVRGLWGHLGQKYRTRVIHKGTAKEMLLIGEAMDMMGLMNKETFAHRMTTTVGRTIYIPFELGYASNDHPLESQLIIGAHEHQHVVQLDAPGGGMKYGISYLMDSTWRAAYEAEAYRVSLTLKYYLEGVMPDLNVYVETLKSYQTTQKDRDFVREYLRLSLPTLKNGGIPDVAAQVSIEWLRSHAPHTLKLLKAQK